MWGIPEIRYYLTFNYLLLWAYEKSYIPFFFVVLKVKTKIKSLLLFMGKSKDSPKEMCIQWISVVFTPIKGIKSGEVFNPIQFLIFTSTPCPL